MTTGVAKLQDEYTKIKKSGILASIGGSAGPTKKRCFKHWKACFIGPSKTPYENGLYYIEMKFSDDYPKKRPDVRMRTPIYHPNIYEGKICVEYLNEWKEDNDVAGIIHQVCGLLSAPNEEDPFWGQKIDENKARELRIKYATESQKYNWDDEDWKGYKN